MGSGMTLPAISSAASERGSNPGRSTTINAAAPGGGGEGGGGKGPMGNIARPTVMARAAAGAGAGSTGSPYSVISTLTSGMISLSGTFERGRRAGNFINMVADVIPLQLLGRNKGR